LVAITQGHLKAIAQFLSIDHFTHLNFNTSYGAIALVQFAAVVQVKGHL
jgi:hypothetical protein